MFWLSKCIFHERKQRNLAKKRRKMHLWENSFFAQWTKKICKVSFYPIIRLGDASYRMSEISWVSFMSLEYWSWVIRAKKWVRWSELWNTGVGLECRKWVGWVKCGLGDESLRMPENELGQLYKRLILLTKCSWRKVGLRERRSRGDSCRKVLLFGRKNVKKTFSLAFFKKILFQNISWYTDIFASVPLHAPPPPCQYFLSVPLLVKQNRQMSSQLVSKGSATANVLKSDSL